MKLIQRSLALAAALGFLFAPVALAQTPAPAAPAAPRKLISPFRGDATVEFTKPVTKRAGANIVTTIVVKNTSPGPLAGFRLEESWSDKSGNLAGGDTYRHPRPLMADEVITITLTTPFNTRMTQQQLQLHSRQRQRQAEGGAEDRRGAEDELGVS